MKRKLVLALLLVLCLGASRATAERARFLREDRDSNRHVSHLASHLGMTDCRVASNYLKVRSRAGGSGVVGHAEQADTVELLDLSGNWAQIRVTYASSTSPDSWEGLQGWVDADYLECPCSRRTYYDNSFDGQYPEGVTTAGGVSVREIPGSGSRTMFTLSNGADVILLGDYPQGNTTWVRIMNRGRTGFVRRDQVSETGGYAQPVAGEDVLSRGGLGADPGMPTYIPAGAMLATVLHDNTNVRDHANGGVIARLRRGATVAILSTTRDSTGISWYSVSFASNRMGYIRADLLQVTGTAASPTRVPSAPAAPPAYPASDAGRWQRATPVPLTPAVSQVDYRGVYTTYLQNHMAQYGAYENAVMQDLDMDGIPEMMVWASLGARSQVMFYTWWNGQVTPLLVDNTGRASGSAGGRDMQDNVVAGGGECYYSRDGIGVLSGGSNSAWESSYAYYRKHGLALAATRELSVVYGDNGQISLTLDGAGVSLAMGRQFLSGFEGAVEAILGNH